jgi:predicted transcriptional regulator
MITKEQLHIGRVSLGLNVAQLARLAGVAPNSIHGIERGADFKASTMRSLQDAMAAEGILFTCDGGVAARMIWPNGRPASRKVREAAMAVLNAARKSRSQCPLMDMEDGA